MPIFRQLNILNFSRLVLQRIALLMYKYHNGMLPSPINELFITNNTVHNYNTRQRNNLHIQIGNGEEVYRLFSFHGIKIWNHLSNKICTNVSYASFKYLTRVYFQCNEIVYRLI